MNSVCCCVVHIPGQIHKCYFLGGAFTGKQVICYQLIYMLVTCFFLVSTGFYNYLKPGLGTLPNSLRSGGTSGYGIVNQPLLSEQGIKYNYLSI